MYDITIIGAGPAGISAGIYAKRANLKVLILYFGESDLLKAEKIDNYYGFPKGIQGNTLYENGKKQAQNLKIEIKKLEVIGIEKKEKNFNVKTTEEIITTKSIIIATGNKKITPNIEGIEEFYGRGISYCAICDAFFYKNKNVVVIGNGKFAINEANELSSIAKNVTILTNGLEKPKCEYKVISKKIKKIVGDNKVRKIQFDDNTTIETDGLFIALGEASAIDFAKIIGIKNDGKNLKINEKMETNVPGIFACGNATGGLLQINKAVYEGARAGLSAIEYVRKKKDDEDKNEK